MKYIICSSHRGAFFYCLKLSSEVKPKMNSYYSGWPYSDELYHHGTKGQQWGRRLYQYEDGSLTPLGRIHYGVGQAGKAVGRGIKSLSEKVKENNKKKHPEKMTDEELQSAIRRLDMERRYSDLVKSKKPAMSRGRRVVGDILESGAKTIANRAFNEAANKLFDEKPDKESMSYRLKKDIEKEFNQKYRSGDLDTIPDQKDLDKWKDAIETIRNIEGNNGGQKKKGKGKGK